MAFRKYEDIEKEIRTKIAKEQEQKQAAEPKQIQKQEPKESTIEDRPDNSQIFSELLTERELEFITTELISIFESVASKEAEVLTANKNFANPYIAQDYYITIFAERFKYLINAYQKGLFGVRIPEQVKEEVKEIPEDIEEDEQKDSIDILDE